MLSEAKDLANYSPCNGDARFAAPSTSVQCFIVFAVPELPGRSVASTPKNDSTLRTL